MAKAIGKEKGAVARTRAARAHVREVPTDEPRDGTTLLADRDDLLNDASASDPADLDKADTVDEADDASEADGGDDLALALPAERHAAPPQLRVSNAASVPAPLLANPITRWFAEAYLELLKVTWPTRREAWNMTIVVVVISAFVAVILGLADFGLQNALAWLISKGLGQ
ncbi:MAG: preprotein translocase subunit SecE [Ktedonobacterales bacterium]